MGGVREKTRSGKEAGEIQVEVLVKGMTDTKERRGTREKTATGCSACIERERSYKVGGQQ